MNDKTKQQDEATKGIDTSRISVDDKGRAEIGDAELDQTVGGIGTRTGGTNFKCANPVNCPAKEAP